MDRFALGLDTEDGFAAINALERLGEQQRPDSPEAAALDLAVRALTYLKGQGAFKWFKQYIDDLDRLPTSTEERNYQILRWTFGQEFEPSDLRDDEDSGEKASRE